MKPLIIGLILDHAKMAHIASSAMIPRKNLFGCKDMIVAIGVV
jgi:hypothetical protein